MPPTEVLLAKLNRKMDVLNKKRDIDRKMNDLDKKLSTKLNKLDKKLSELDKTHKNHHNGEMTKLNNLLYATNGTPISCTDNPPTLDNNKDGDVCYKWVQFSNTVKKVMQPLNNEYTNINFVKEDGTQYKKKEDVCLYDIIYVKDNVVDHIKIPLKWFPDNTPCTFGFVVQFADNSNVPNGTYHYSSTEPLPGIA